FSQGWTQNIRTLAKGHWWDGTSVYRVVDNWDAQWGDGEDDQAKAKPLPEGLRVVPESEYTSLRWCDQIMADSPHPFSRCRPPVLHQLPDPNVPEGLAAFSNGWPIALMSR